MTPLISTNRKTGSSLNFPTTNCRPTKICKKLCYGKAHYMGNSQACLAKWIRVSDYLAQTHDCQQLIEEARQLTALRLCGTGDLIPGHINNLIKLAKACPQTQFWGMTRKTDIAARINGRLDNLHLLVSIDASSPDKTWNYQGALCFGPRRAKDPVPEDPRIITVFPYHNAGKVVGHVPEHRLDCPAVRHTVKGCFECKRCWSW